MLFACDSGSGAGGNYCETLTERGRECGFLGEGKINCVNYDDRAEACEVRCIEDASCSSIETVACSTFLAEDSVSICFSRCIGLEPVTCDDESVLAGWTRCDGFEDCPVPAEGELAADERDCENDRRRCRNVDETYPLEGYCDGEDDCSDGSDEPPDCDVLRTCESDFGTLDVTSFYVCNGVADCLDGSDEPDDCAPRMCGGD